MTKTNSGAGESRDKDTAKEGEHWASPGLPPPPVNDKKALKHVPTTSGDATNTPGDDPADRRDSATDEWIKDAKVKNTQAGD